MDTCTAICSWLQSNLTWLLSFKLEACILIFPLSLGIAACHWYYNHHNVKYLKPNFQLKRQTLIIDQATGTRMSTLDAMKEWDKSLVTMYDMFRVGLVTHRDQPCFGRRRTLEAPVQWVTYGEVDEIVRQLGSALHYLCGERTEENYMIGIYSPNSPEWMYTALACHAYRFVTVPLYETVGKEGLLHICQQAEPTFVLCDKAEPARNILKWATSKLKTIIVVEEDEEFERLKSSEPRVTSLRDTIELGRQHMSEPMTPPRDKIALICYTSGSEGPPKGVMLTYRNFIAVCTCTAQVFERFTGFPKDYAHLCYLPLAHVFEHFNISVHLYKGARIGFKTKDMTGFLSDLQTYQPAYVPAVPRILMRIYTGFMGKVGKHRIIRWFLRLAIKQKLREQKNGWFKKNGIIDYLIFRPVREKMGGKIELLCSAGAPLSAEVMDFTRAALSCPVIEVYGSTEGGGVTSSTLGCDTISGHSGCICPTFQAKLADVPEMDLIVSRDKLGEICVKSDSCTVGYYKDEARTKALFDSEGFVRMGDIGAWTPEGALKVVDRCRNVFKLAQGEYICPGKIEEIYSTSPLVCNVYVEGDSFHAFPVAVVEPDLMQLRRRLYNYLHRNGHSVSEHSLDRAQILLANMSDEEICRNPVAKQIVVEDLTQAGKKNGLKGFEQIKAVHLTPDRFTIDNKLLTPTMKLSRPNVRRHFAAIVEDLYSEFEG
ncbi:unnamed protein product [Calicophoron daubneyi]|uniref:long-chain-fatty-acid--CoA ligase n=1 Tax=Calicophoron daubneyi TaxID=300641 RepID=A0AAV2TI09_CALDB